MRWSASLSYKNAGIFRHNPRGENLELSTIKPPVRDQRRLTWGYHIVTKKVEVLETSRGCTRSCNFCCMRHMYGRSFRTFPIERVLADLDDIYYERKTRWVFLSDDNIVLNVKRVMQLCDGIIARNYKNLMLTVQADCLTIAANEEMVAKMARIPGKSVTLDDRTALKNLERDLGLVIFGQDRAIRELSAAIRAVRPDLLLAVDQEGGRVQRLRQGFVRLPAMRALADNPNAEYLAEQCGWIMATEVLAVGLDLSFAPVLDLDYQRSAVVGTRSFEGDPERAAVLAGAFIRGMNSAGMAATGKHFPGHGWAEADSHVAIPTDERSLEQIRANDLVPFARLSKQLAAVMPAHVIYPQVDVQPAGFSRRWLQDILRGELQFDGVIFSDDLSMAGAHVVGDAASRIEAALTAGCDMGLVCNDRAAAELALSAAQRMKVTPSARIARMRGQAVASTDYKQDPRWLAALTALRDAQLIE